MGAPRTRKKKTVALGARSKRARKIRNAGEFVAAQLQTLMSTPRLAAAVFAWSLEDIFAARQQQMVGQFKYAARLAESMRTDDALFVAYENRLAPLRCLRVELRAPDNARAQSIKAEADALFGPLGVGLRAETIPAIQGDLVNHGVAFAINDVVPRDDGSRVDFFVRHWPIEFVRWDAVRRCFLARTEDGSEVQIVHGDGRWIVFARADHEPWKHGALLPGAAVWGRHAFAIRDWTKGSNTHGNAKIIGEMADGVALESDDENAENGLTPQAASFAKLLLAMVNDETPVGIRPAGSKTEILETKGTNWQVFSELVLNGERAAARIYLGTDGTLGAQGGAPGVDLYALFGVANTKVQGDIDVIERAVLTGIIEPWCAMNFGDSSLAPRRVYVVPDGDEAAARDAFAKQNAAFMLALKTATDAKLVLTQAYVDKLAAKYGVPSLVVPAAPALPAASGAAA